MLTTKQLLGRNIARFRAERGFSQNKLAKSVNKSQSAISSWETGRTEPSLQELHQLARALKVDVTALQFETGPTPARTPAPPDPQALLLRIAEALERLAPPLAPSAPLDSADGFVWRGGEDRLVPVPAISRVEIDLLKGVERQKRLLIDNTTAFAQGRPANNALLWGARGAGKSSLVKAVHAAVAAEVPAARLALVEVHREDLPLLPRLLERLRASPRRFLLFCDDLSFDAGEAAYKALKVVLEGGLEGRPDNALFYATSNRRHLISRDMIENERSTALNPGEAVEEKVSLSDRFGLWIGFAPQDQAQYLEIVAAYADAFALPWDREQIRAAALRWSVQRGARSGRVAWQFIEHLRGSEGAALEG